jgi:hypothetical protein
VLSAEHVGRVSESELEEPFPVFDPCETGTDIMARNTLHPYLLRFTNVTHITVSYETQGSAQDKLEVPGHQAAHRIGCPPAASGMPLKSL